MSRSAKANARHSAAGISILTLGLVSGGFVFFYLASQALTPENAHLIHWGLAIAGGLLGWAVGHLVERLQTRPAWARRGKARP